MRFLAHKSEAPKFEVAELSGIEHKYGDRTIRPEAVYRFTDPTGRFNADKGGVIGHIVIANSDWSDRGLSKGGTAMYPGCSLANTVEKADVMARKQVPCHPLGKVNKFDRWGGAKGGIDFAKFTDGTVDSELVWRGIVKAAWEAGIVPGKYIFGLDVGTNERAAAAACDQIESPLVCTGKPRALGGVEYDKQGFAGRGTVLVAREMCTHKGFDLDDPTTRIVIEGFGAVGIGAAMDLCDKPSRVIAITDADAKNEPFCLFSHEGLDLKRLIRMKRETGSIASFSGANVAKKSGMDAIDTDCEVMILASSKTNSIDERNTKCVKCRVVAQGANLGVTEGAEETLWRRGILTLPAEWTNYASSASVLVEYAHAFHKVRTPDLVGYAWDYVSETMRHNTRFMLGMVARTNMSPLQIGKVVTSYEFIKAINDRRI
jgi:glutamate dehydrogenase (NAD(P)+)